MNRILSLLRLFSRPARRETGYSTDRLAAMHREQAEARRLSALAVPMPCWYPVRRGETEQPVTAIMPRF